MTLNQTKSDTLNLRVTPALKTALRNIAEREHRSMVNTLECLILEYCKKHNLVLPNDNKKVERKDAPREQRRSKQT